MDNNSDLTLPASWYRPSPDMQEFHKSRATIRALVGGRGTGKTTGIAVEAISHCFFNAGAKAYILRKTQDSNQDTTLETFEHQVFPNMGTAYQDTGVSLFKKLDGGKCFRFPSQMAVEKFNAWKTTTPRATKAQTLVWLESVGNLFCSWVYFAGVPEERYRASRFRGYECSLLIFVEADQLAKEDLDLGVATLRWKGADPATCDNKGFIRDSGIILDTNPPGTKHWIAKLEKESKDDPSVRFWHLRTRDNAHNLPAGYTESLERQYRSNPAMYDRMVLGKYADAFDGTPVLYSFHQSHAYENLPWPSGAYLIRGWDFGSTHAVVFSAYWADDKDEYWWDLHEYFARQSDVDRQCKAVLEITESVFPFWNDRSICSGVKDYCDPAGNAKTDKGSSVKVLHTYDIHPGFIRMGLQESIAVYNRLLTKKDRFDKDIYRIDKGTCPMLYIASGGGYRYPVEGEPGFGGDEPLKGPAGGDYDHICFSGDTLILTEFGEKPISEIRAGGFVWTRAGLRRVLQSWRTASDAETRGYSFTNGRSFRATKNHPVWTCVGEWREVCCLDENDSVLCVSSEFAPRVERSIFRTATPGLGLGVVRYAGPTSPARREPVYNLTVEGEHEYFASGILVSNCDASRYAKFNCLRLLREEVEQSKNTIGALERKETPNISKRYY